MYVILDTMSIILYTRNYEQCAFAPESALKAQSNSTLVSRG